jgi:hypothetical protein
MTNYLYRVYKLDEGIMVAIGVAFWFGVIGIIFFLAGGSGIFASIQSKRWPTIKGKIVESKSIYRQTKRKFKGMWVYVPKIKYSFDIDDNTYTSGRIYFGGYNTSIKSISDSLIKKYPLNSEVTIYYNRKNPEESVLEPGFTVDRHIFQIIIMLMGLPFLFLSLSLLFAVIFDKL